MTMHEDFILDHFQKIISNPLLKDPSTLFLLLKNDKPLTILASSSHTTIFNIFHDDSRHSLLSWLDANDAMHLVCTLSEAIKSHTDSFLSEPIRLQHNNGTTLWIQLNFKSLFSPDDTMTHFFVSTKDITSEQTLRSYNDDLQKQHSLLLHR